MSDWSKFQYHTYEIRGRTREATEGDFEKWVAEVFVDGQVLFQFRLIISRSELATRVSRSNESGYLEAQGLLRLHARLDFGEYHPGPRNVHEHTIMSGTETIAPNFILQHEYEGQFLSEHEKITYHTFRALRRLRYETHGNIERSSFDITAWAYYLGVSEDSIIRIMRKLHQEGKIDAIWVPSPVMDGAYQLAGGLGISSQGLDSFENLQSDLTQRRRDAVMPDIEENAFRIARYLRDHNFVSANMTIAAEVRNALGMSLSDFDAADSFLRETGMIMGTLGGDSARLVLKANGIAFVSKKLSERLHLTADAETLARYLANNQGPSKSFTLGSEIQQELAWDQSRYWAAAQILIDESLAEERPRADNAPLMGLAVSSEGRKAVRRNFRQSGPAVNVHTGDRISVETSGRNTAVAAGRGASVVQNVNDSSVNQLFHELIRQAEANPGLSDEARQEVREVVELAQAEANSQDGIDESQLTYFFRRIATLAPDILDVALAALTFPVAGPLPVVLVIAKKVADKAKADASKNRLA